MKRERAILWSLVWNRIDEPQALSGLSAQVPARLGVTISPPAINSIALEAPVVEPDVSDRQRRRPHGCRAGLPAKAVTKSMALCRESNAGYGSFELRLRQVGDHDS